MDTNYKKLINLKSFSSATNTNEPLRFFIIMEVWKDVEDYEGYYQVSNLGNVKSLKRLTAKNLKEFNLKLSFGTDKYKIVCLTKNNIKKTFKIHRLVAKAFILNPENKIQVNHINGIRHDTELKT